MALPPGWSAPRALAALPLGPWQGDVWRRHGLDLDASRRAGMRIYYEPTSDGGSRKDSGRYHRAPDKFPGHRVWPVLYTSLTDGVCLAEVIRAAGSLDDLDTLRMALLHVELTAVLDLTDPRTYGLTRDDVVSDDYAVTQEIGLAALLRGTEGMLVPAASLLGANLVILTENLKADSVLVPVDSVDPRLRR